METTEDYIKFFQEGLVEPNDFALQCNAFLDKMKQSSAYELVKSIKRFVTTFTATTRQPQPIEERVAEVREFLDETSLVIEKHPLWKGAGDDEIEMAAEALERYLMHKVFKAVYSPDREDDARRDREFLQRLKRYSFIEPCHLDINMTGSLCAAAWKVASNQLHKMESCRSPRDKVTCVMNCCTVLNKLIVRYHAGSPGGADDLLPTIIYSILRAQPSHWFSDVRYIQRFRHPGRLSAEAGYYMTQMMGAVAFLEKLDPQYLSIDREEFERLTNWTDSDRVGEKTSTADGKNGTNSLPTSVPSSRKGSGSSHEDSTPPCANMSYSSLPSLPSSQPSSLPSSESNSPQLLQKGLGEGQSYPQTKRKVESSQDVTASEVESSQDVTASRASRADSEETKVASTSPALISQNDEETKSASTSPLISQNRVPDEEADSLLSSISSTQSLSAIGRKPPRQVSTSILQSPRKDEALSLDRSSLPTQAAAVQESGIVERFLDCRLKEVTIGDVSELLKNYRILVHKYCALRTQVNAQSVSCVVSQPVPSLTITKPLSSQSTHSIEPSSQQNATSGGLQKMSASVMSSQTQTQPSLSVSSSGQMPSH